MTKDETETAIHELQHSLKALQHQFAEFERTRPVTARPAPVMDREMTIQQLPPTMPEGFPSDTVLQACLNIVRAKYPSACASDDAFFGDFRSACIWLAVAGRTDTPNTKHYLADLGDRAEDFLRDNHLPRNNPGRGLLAAAISSCDIAYVVGDRHAGILPAIGIASHGGRAPSPRWGDLAAGFCGLLAPVQPELPPSGTPVFDLRGPYR
jgi:hypothetical protein